MKHFGYNPKRDLHRVDCAAAGVDLRLAYVNKAVPAVVSGADLSYNDVDDPEGMIPHPSDVFESMRQRDYVKSSVSEKTAKAEAEAARLSD